ELPPVEAPSQQHSRAEVQPGRDRRQCRERVPERRRPERHHGAQEQDTARQDVREEPVQLTAAGIWTAPSGEAGSATAYTSLTTPSVRYAQASSPALAASWRRASLSGV